MHLRFAPPTTDQLDRLRCEALALGNLRVLSQDAVEVFEHRLPPACLDEVLLYFPDPWPKKRHHKRRIVQDAFVAMVASRLTSGGVFRLATDWHYFARPTKTLFNDIRIYFPMSAQERVYRVVDRYITFAKDYFSSMPMSGYDIEGRRIECRATTRRGTPCQRTPLPANGYCPSHQHLAEPDEIAIAA